MVRRDDDITDLNAALVSRELGKDGHNGSSPLVSVAASCERPKRRREVVDTKDRETEDR